MWVRYVTTYRLYSKGRARRRQKGAHLQLPSATKNSEAHTKEHRKAQNEDSASMHTKRAHSSTRRRDHRELSKEQNKQQHAWNELGFAELIPKKLPPRVVAKHRAKIAKARRVQELRKEDGALVPSPPSRVVNTKRFFGKDFDVTSTGARSNANEHDASKSIVCNESESSNTIVSAVSKRRPNSGGSKNRVSRKRKSLLRSSSTRVPRSTIESAPSKCRANSDSPEPLREVTRKSIIHDSNGCALQTDSDQVRSHVHVCAWMNTTALAGATSAINPIVRQATDDAAATIRRCHSGPLIPFSKMHISVGLTQSLTHSQTQRNPRHWSHLKALKPGTKAVAGHIVW